jgi:GTPase SAR1 family protein
LKDDVELEESYQGKFTDYTFKVPKRVLIVEAKKEGDYFDAPAGKNKLEYSIPSLSRDYPNLKAAIEQAVGYCQSRGVPFGAVSNGHQVVAFVATRLDGLPPLRGKALVFPSLDVMLSNFLELWNALSKPAIAQKKLQSRLVGDILPELPPKLSARISSYPGIKGRNELQTDLQIVSELVIEDIARSRELEPLFLERCYCQSGALSQHSLASKAILQARYAALFESSAPAPPTPVPSVNKKGEISPELLAKSLSRRPILLIGDVGVGKTTFIRHLIKVDAAALFANAITLYIDLGSQATMSLDLKAFIPKEITRQLREKYNIDSEEESLIYATYNLELQRFSEKSIYAKFREKDPTLYEIKKLELIEEKLANKEQHLSCVLQHIAKGRKKQIVVVLDNSDQRTEDTQQLAFLVSQELAERWPVTVFVALRPETFHRSKREGALSGYHPKAFTISPPRIDQVIEKRLRFAIKITKGEIPITSLPETTRINFTKLDKIIRIFLHSLNNKELAEFIDNICGGNIRLALDLVKGFFGSGHIDTQTMLNIYDESGRYDISLHQFLRAVIFGDAEHYDPDQSPIANLFDASRYDPKEHFIMPLSIGIISSLEGASMQEGFVEIYKIYDQLQELRFTPEQIEIALIKGLKKKLIEAPARRIPQPGQTMPNTLRVTTIGRYHIERLCRFFTYLDAVIVDTPIFDANLYGFIHDVQNISDRLNRSEIFCQYLDAQWYEAFRDSRTWFDWSSVSVDIKIDIERIRVAATSSR